MVLGEELAVKQFAVSARRYRIALITFMTAVLTMIPGGI